MDSDHLHGASRALIEAVESMGGDEFLASIDGLVRDNEEWTTAWFDGLWDDLAADEIIDWSIAKLAETAPTIAHAALDVALRTYPVDDDAEDAETGDATIISAFVRVVLDPKIRADRYELDFRHLGEWILHDAVQFTGGHDETAPPSG